MLARELGYTLNDLLDSLGEGELDLWYELHKRQPLSNPWLQTGRLCATFANFNAWGLQRPLQAEEFMPLHREPPTPEQLRRAFLAAMAGLGIAIVDKSCSNSPAASRTAS